MSSKSSFAHPTHFHFNTFTHPDFHLLTYKTIFLSLISKKLSPFVFNHEFSEEHGLYYTIPTECKLLPYNLQGAEESVTTRNFSPCEWTKNIQVLPRLGDSQMQILDFHNFLKKKSKIYGIVEFVICFEPCVLSF
jgi:hypothetical protein